MKIKTDNIIRYYFQRIREEKNDNPKINRLLRLMASEMQDATIDDCTKKLNKFFKEK